MTEISSNWPVFIGVTLCLFGGGALMVGQALASTWRPLWQVATYTLLVGMANRFIKYALFDGSLLSFPGYLVDTAILLLIALLAYRFTQVKSMVKQYPWMIEKTSPLGWQNKDGNK